jgi:hypothetical protein
MFIEIQAVFLVLRKWKESPAATRREIGIWAHWKEDREENDRPLSPMEVQRMKGFLRRHAPSSFIKLFPEELQG